MPRAAGVFALARRIMRLATQASGRAPPEQTVFQIGDSRVPCFNKGDMPRSVSLSGCVVEPES